MPETAVLQGTTFRLRCLGPVSFVAPDGLPRRFRTRKQMGLLLVLARRAGRPQGREQLVELLWGGDEPRAARHSLAQSISLINKAFGQDAIRFAGKDQVTLREGLVWLDADEFEQHAAAGRYEEARGLWRGNLMEGLWVQRAPAFEAWVDSERQRLKRLHRTVLHAAVEAERTAGNWSAMRATAESLLESDPLDEAAMLGYLEALTLAGDRTLALRRFAEFESRLKDELDAEPGVALKAWIKRQRKGEELPTPAPSVFPRVAETQTLPTARPVYGREAEFKVLWDAWTAAQQSQGSFIILEGPAGIGKSALAGKLANQAHVMGGAVCFVRCWRTEKSVPFAPITALIRQLMRLPGFVALNEVWIGELSRLVPELRERYPNAPAPMAIDDSARHRICDGTLHAASCISDEEPLMMIVDDVHCADEASLALLHYFARQTPRLPVMLVCTSRTNVAETSLERAFFETARTLRVAKFLELRSLAYDQSAKIAREALAQRGLEAPEWALSLLYERASGVPLQVIESVMALPNKGPGSSQQWAADLRQHFGTPETFETSSTERLSSLPETAQRVAAALAVAARPLTDYELSSVLRLPASVLIRAVADLERAHFVRRTATSVTFVHDEYQTSTQQNLDRVDATALHLALAELLAKSAAEDPGARCEVARHYELAGRHPEARVQALKAAEYAASIGATKERAAALELAFRASPVADVEVGLALGRSLLATRDCSSVARLCHHLRAIAPPLLPDQAIELSYLELAQAHFAGIDDLETTSNQLERLLLNASAEFPDLLQAHIVLMRALDRAGHHARARRAARRLRLLARRSSSPSATAYTLVAAGWVIGKYYRPDKALALLRAALNEAQCANALAVEQLCREGISVMLNSLGRYDEALGEHELNRLVAQRLLDPLGEATCLNNLGVAELNLCLWAEAEQHLGEAIRLASNHPDWPNGTYPRLNLGVLCYLQRRFADAVRELQLAHEHARRKGHWFLGLLTAGALGMCAIRREDFEELRIWAEFVKAEWRGREKEITDLDYIVATLAWNGAVNETNAKKAFELLDWAARYTAKRDVDHSLSVQMEAVLLREHLSGRRQDEGRSALLHRVGTVNPRLKAKYEYLMSQA